MMPLYVLLVVLGCWLLHPILFPVPVEGFSAAILGLGVHLAQGGLSGFDQLQPFHTEFFGLAKLGAVLGIAGLVKTLGIDGETALRLMIWSSEAVLLVSTFILARRWSGATPLIAAFAVLLVPGVIENSFFYAENLVAAALTTLGLVCIGSRSFVLAPLIGGAFFGLGVLTRPDTIVVGIVTPLLVVERSGLTGRSAISLVAAAIGGAITWLGPLHLMGVTPFDVMKVGDRYFEILDRNYADLHDLLRGLLRQFRQDLIFIGLPAGLLAAIGVAALIRQRALLRLAILLVPVLVVNVLFFSTLQQSRQLLPLAPFVAALAAVGLLQLLPQPGENRAGLWARGAVIAAIVLILLVPGRTAYDDGPRDLLGRIPGILHWRDWQATVAAEMTAIGQAVAADRADLRIVITDEWDQDRYVHFALQDAGFRVQRLAEIEPACGGVAESFVRGSQRVLHLRVLQGFTRYYAALSRERFDTMVRPCLDLVAPAEMVLVVRQERLDILQDAGATPIVWPPPARGFIEDQLRRLFPDKPSPIRALAIDADMIDRMSRAYAALEETGRRVMAGKGVALPSASEAAAATRSIIPFPKGD